MIKVLTWFRRNVDSCSVQFLHWVVPTPTFFSLSTVIIPSGWLAGIRTVRSMERSCIVYVAMTSRVAERALTVMFSKVCVAVWTSWTSWVQRRGLAYFVVNLTEEDCIYTVNFIALSNMDPRHSVQQLFCYTLVTLLFRFSKFCCHLQTLLRRSMHSLISRWMVVPSNLRLFRTKH